MLWVSSPKSFKNYSLEHNAVNTKADTWQFCTQGEPLLTWSLAQFFSFSSCGMVLVTTTASNMELLILEHAGPDNIPCVQIA